MGTCKVYCPLPERQEAWPMGKGRTQDSCGSGSKGSTETHEPAPLYQRQWLLIGGPPKTSERSKQASAALRTNVPTHHAPHKMAQKL